MNDSAVRHLADPGTTAFKLRRIGLVSAIVVIIFSIVMANENYRDASDAITQSTLGALVVVAVLAWTLRKNPWSLADEVIDDGAILVVRRRTARAQIAFAKITQVDRYSAYSRDVDRNIRLTLSEATVPFGTEIVFRPNGCTEMTTQELNQFINELRVRASHVPAQQEVEVQSETPTSAGWFSLMSFRRKRAIRLLVLLCLGLPIVNGILGLHFFSPFDVQIMLASIVLLVLCVRFISPSAAEFDVMVDAKRKQKSDAGVSR